MKTRNKISTSVVQKMRSELLFLSAGIAITGIIICLMVYFNIGSYEDAKAAGSSYSSNRTGSWSTGNTWNGGVAPGVSLNGDAITVNTNHTVTLSGNLSAQNNSSFVINSSAILRIEGDLTVQNNLVLTVYGELIVTGKIDAKNGASIGISGGGNITTGGDFIVGNNASINVDGTLNIGGGLTFGSNPVFTGTGTVNISGTGCNQWSGSGTCNENITLPVELMAFEALNSDEGVLLRWKTASELNNDMFTIERSDNGIDYDYIASVKGNGTTKIISDYRYTDTNPLNGISYYRLLQTDYDGAVTIFKPVSVKINSSTTSSFSVYPNPLTGSTLNINFSEPQEALIRVIDANGNEVLSERVDGSANQTQVALNENLPSGFYYIKYVTSTSTKSMKLVKH